MGQPFSAAFAAVWNFPGSAPGTFAATSRWIDFTVQPASVLSKFRVAFVSIRSGWYPSFSSSLYKAIEKQPACAAATSSSGFVPGVSPNRVAKLYGMPLRAPLNVDTVPFPSFRPPFHCALARRSIESPAGPKSSGNLNVCLLRWISHEVPPFRPGAVVIRTSE